MQHHFVATFLRYTKTLGKACGKLKQVAIVRNSLIPTKFSATCEKLQIGKSEKDSEENYLLVDSRHDSSCMYDFNV